MWIAYFFPLVVSFIKLQMTSESRSTTSKKRESVSMSVDSNSLLPSPLSKHDFLQAVFYITFHFLPESYLKVITPSAEFWNASFIQYESLPTPGRLVKLKELQLDNNQNVSAYLQSLHDAYYLQLGSKLDAFVQLVFQAHPTPAQNPWRTSCVAGNWNPATGSARLNCMATLFPSHPFYFKHDPNWDKAWRAGLGPHTKSIAPDTLKTYMHSLTHGQAPPEMKDLVQLTFDESSFRASGGGGSILEKLEEISFVSQFQFYIHAFLLKELQHVPLGKWFALWVRDKDDTNNGFNVLLRSLEENKELDALLQQFNQKWTKYMWKAKGK